VTELVIAAYAAETGSHIVAVPRDKRFRAFARRFDERAYLRGLEPLGIRWLPRTDPGFPHGLCAIFDPPAGLFLRGGASVELLDAPSVAVVGARSCSPYGAHVARLLGRELAAAGLLVVSGMARGIDGEAHRGALEAGGRTVAVLGCGVDRDYPAAHADLARRICEEGLIVSEYAPGVEPAPWRFPARNRIIAGLAAATVVVEARERSGALITADLALEEGREVFAVPGEITSALSDGTNRLLALGAAPLTQVEDVLRSFGIEKRETPVADVSEPAEQVLARLRDTPLGADELARATELDAGPLAAALSELEVAGLVAEAAGVYRAIGN
jgi:DNA processing protein